MKQKTIVISGINMVEGGIFTILDNCLQKISDYSQLHNLKVIALVHDKSKFNYPNIEYIEFPKSKKFWFWRLYLEYFYFKKLSKNTKPDVWFSLHDVSPNVAVKKRFVYCHHATLFYKSTLKDWKFDYKIGLFSIFYKYLYRINIKKNNAVFVQQHWIKKEFESIFNIGNVIVCKPEYVEKVTTNKTDLPRDKIHFLYPSFPRTFKNYEIIFDALELLDKSTKDKIKFHFTAIRNNSTKYARHLFKKYSPLKEVIFWNTMDKDELSKLYNSTDCVVFPSKLETWGLPLSEAKAFQKPILSANLPYAKEAVGDYDTVCFFDANDPKELANLITQFVDKTIQYHGNSYPFDNNAQLNNWNSIFDYIFKD